MNKTDKNYILKRIEWFKELALEVNCYCDQIEGKLKEIVRRDKNGTR